MTVADAHEPFVLGPDDTLVLVTKERFSVEALLRIREQVPNVAADRVLVVDGDAFDVHIVRGESS